MRCTTRVAIPVRLPAYLASIPMRLPAYLAAIPMRLPPYLAAIPGAVVRTNQPCRRRIRCTGAFELNGSANRRIDQRSNQVTGQCAKLNALRPTHSNPPGTRLSSCTQKAPPFNQALHPSAYLPTHCHAGSLPAWEKGLPAWKKGTPWPSATRDMARWLRERREGRGREGATCSEVKGREGKGREVNACPQKIEVNGVIGRQFKQQTSGKTRGYVSP